MHTPTEKSLVGYYTSQLTPEHLQFESGTQAAEVILRTGLSPY